MDEFEAQRKRLQKLHEEADERIKAGREARTPEAREKILRRAQEIVNEGQSMRQAISSQGVLAVARFLAGEPG
jgi:vacuolar-type H+-ATPase subunit H